MKDVKSVVDSQTPRVADVLSPGGARRPSRSRAVRGGGGRQRVDGPALRGRPGLGGAGPGRCWRPWTPGDGRCRRRLLPGCAGSETARGPTPGAPCPGDSEPRRLPHASAVPRASGLSNEPAGVPSPPSPEEPIAQRVLRQARTGQLDEDRLLPGKDKRERDPTKKLDKLAAQAGWYTFVSTKRTRSPRGRPPARRNAEWWCRR